MIHSASFLCSAYDDLSNVYWKGRAKAESGFKEWATSRVLCSIKKEKVILSVQSCQCRLPKQLLLDGMGCFYWLFRNSFKRLFSLNFTCTLTLRHWECHWQLPKSPVADSNLHRLFCILVYVEKGVQLKYFLVFTSLPLSPPSPLFSGLGKYDSMFAQEEADLWGSVLWHCTQLGLLRQGALHEWRQVLITHNSAAIPLWKWDFGAVMRLCRGPITVPENH